MLILTVNCHKCILQVQGAISIVLHLKLPMVCNKLFLLTVLILATPDLVIPRQRRRLGDMSRVHFPHMHMLEQSPSVKALLAISSGTSHGGSYREE